MIHYLFLIDKLGFSGVRHYVRTNKKAFPSGEGGNRRLTDEESTI